MTARAAQPPALMNACFLCAQLPLFAFDAQVSELGLENRVRFVVSFTDSQRAALLAACTAVVYTPQVGVVCVCVCFVCMHRHCTASFFLFILELGVALRGFKHHDAALFHSIRTSHEEMICCYHTFTTTV